MWCIQKITQKYRKRMYDILDLYEEKYNPLKPVIGIDEKPKQLIEDSRTPIPLKKGKYAKQDYEYIRRGNANIFMSVEPKGGKRYTEVTNQRTKKDFALYMKYLVDKKYCNVELLRTIVDNLNTHNESSFYETFDAREVNAWEKRRNRQRRKINWAFTKEKADKKLGKYYTE